MTRDASLMSISTLSELLEQGQSAFVCYDLGRRIQSIDAATFRAIEQQQAPYPYPVQGHACFAVVFWPQLADQRQEPYLWFLKFPVDERGLLEQAQVLQFVTSVLTLLGNQITHALDDAQQQQLQQSPFLFTPAEEKRAALHAQLSQRWQREPSQHFAKAQLILQQPDDWQQLGVQGLHDVCARLAELPQCQHAIADRFAAYPVPLRQALAIALEHQQLPDAMVAPLVQQLTQAPERSELRADLLRSLASRANHGAVVTALNTLLPTASVDELVICCARLWQTFDPLQTEHVALQLLLQTLAAQDNHVFAALISDLLRLPSLRPHLMVTLQRDDLPHSIRQAWQQFIGRH
jgi:hypothetical protein